MLEPVFLTLVNRSLTALWLAAAVLVLRFVFRGAPKWTRGVLWALLAVRLVLPFGVSSRFSVYNMAQRETDWNGNLEYMRYAGEGTDSEAFGLDTQELMDGPPVPVAVYPPWVSAVWALGAGGMLLYALVSWLRLRRRVSASLPLGERVMLCDGIDGPFILGVFRPQIYLPSALTSPWLEHVLAHERAHLARRDHWWKPLGFLLLSVYWFNPALWLCYVLFCRDLELACDERAVRELEREERVGYAQALLDCSRGHFGTAPCPLSFGETGVRERVREILRRQKPAPWLAAAALCACLVAAVCFLTSPRDGAGGAAPLWLSGEDAVLSYVMENYEVDGKKIAGGIYIENGASYTGDGPIGYLTFIVYTQDNEQYDLKAWGPLMSHKSRLLLGGYRTWIGPEMEVVDVAWRKSTGAASDW